MNSQHPHKGYYKRIGYIPHFDKPELVQSITFRLADSLPQHVIEQMQADPKWMIDFEQRKQIEKYMDSGHGECQLKIPEIAELVQNALFFYDEVINSSQDRAGTPVDPGKADRAGTSVDPGTDRAGTPVVPEFTLI